jgi:hypothetical protein
VISQYENDEFKNIPVIGVADYTSAPLDKWSKFLDFGEEVLPGTDSIGFNSDKSVIYAMFTFETTMVFTRFSTLDGTQETTKHTMVHSG